MESMKSLIAAALNVPVVDDWEICNEDKENGLVLVHTTEDADLVKYGWIKGLVLDTQTWKVVCQSYGSSTTVSLSMTRPLTPAYVYDKETRKSIPTFKMNTLDGQKLELSGDRLQWVDGYDGTLLRVWKYKGKVYVSSHKRIHTDTSAWGGSPPFRKLYTDLGGPTDALFGAEESSRAVYTFLLVHPALQIGSHVPLKKTFFLYLGEHLLAGEGALPEPVPLLSTLETPNMLTLEQVNTRLKYGFYSEKQNELLMTDARLGHGEFVMCFEYTDATKTKIERCIKVQSDAYTWRVNMRNNAVNLEELTFTLGGLKRRDLRERMAWREFINRYPPVALPTAAELPYIVPRLVPQNEVANSQRQIAVAALVFATHPERQAEVLKHFSTYMRAVESVRAWVLRLDALDTAAASSVFAAIEAQKKGEHVAKRLRDILQKSQGRASTKKTPEEKAKELESSVRYLVDNEYGDSLYKIYTLQQALGA